MTAFVQQWAFASTKISENPRFDDERIDGCSKHDWAAKTEGVYEPQERQNCRLVIAVPLDCEQVNRITGQMTQGPQAALETPIFPAFETESQVFHRPTDVVRYWSCNEFTDTQALWAFIHELRTRGKTITASIQIAIAWVLRQEAR